ncbi:hypothetical protein PoB_006448600 [Plakobranchus ocellatus]|uniref:Uncharacterized protein n=1 Tax=Plakobranchus ocellatus TaxID=259542 RepID=A0AAV4D1X3_9GAST|nr:hypothetical protein PoB_006448600 [Plakobranchus ocellatus]
MEIQGGGRYPDNQRSSTEVVSRTRLGLLHITGHTSTEAKACLSVLNHASSFEDDLGAVEGHFNECTEARRCAAHSKMISSFFDTHGAQSRDRKIPGGDRASSLTTVPSKAQNSDEAKER